MLAGHRMMSEGGVAAIALTLLTYLALPAKAQQYPDRPVKIVLPFGAGGVADVTARSSPISGHWSAQMAASGCLSFRQLMKKTIFHHKLDRPSSAEKGV